MLLYALYYYDRPLLEAWLSHYCQFKCIEEIIIQDQNWSDVDSKFMLETVANYIDKYNKKIVVLPSNFIHVEGKSKRSQFASYGQSKIRNRVLRFLQGKTFIAGSMDEVIYDASYPDTGRRLSRFEDLAEERAGKGLSTIGYIPLYCAWKRGIFPCNSIPIRLYKTPTWRHRLFRFVKQFRRKPSLVHDTTYQIHRNKWENVTPSSHIKTKKAISRYKNGIALNLKLIHYHTMVHPSFESPDFVLPKRNEVKNVEKHPEVYLNKLLTGKPTRRARRTTMPLTPQLKALVERWNKKIVENVKGRRDWYHGLPYKWWWGLTKDQFLTALPMHLKRKREPKWRK